MPNVTVTPRQMGNGDVVSQFIDSVGITPVTYTYPKTQEKFIMRNMGPASLSVTVAGVTQVIERGEKWQKIADFTSFSINAVSGYVAFDAWADEKGSTFDTAEGQYFQSNGGGTGGGSGALVYSTLSDLQAALPGGSTSPVWVTSDNSWYYWSGTVTADTTAPTITANPVAGTYMGTQSVQLTANEAATIYYTTDGTTPTISSSVYSSAISVSATGTIKAIAKDTAGNTSAPVSFVYTITTVTIPATPATPTATAGNNNVDLAWTVVSGATSYKVYRGGTLLASPTTNSYSDTTAVNGTTYSYTVSAVNSAGESAQSSAASATPVAAPAGLTSVTSGMLHSYDLRGGTGYTGTVTDTVGTMPLTLTNFKTDATEGFVTGGLKHAGATEVATGAGYAINTTVANLGMTTGSSFTVIVKASLNASNYATNFFATSKDNTGIHIDGVSANTVGRFNLGTSSVGATCVHPKLIVRDSTSASTTVSRDDAGTAPSSVSTGASPTPAVYQVTYDAATKNVSLYLNGTLNKSVTLTNHMKFDSINLCSGQKVDHALLIYNRVLSGAELTQVSTDLLALS